MNPASLSQHPDLVVVSRNDDQSYLIDSQFDLGSVDLHVASNAHEWPEEPHATGQNLPIAVDGLEPNSRHYFHLRDSSGLSHVVAERPLPLDGGTNFRDFGGYRTRDGRQVRWGRLFRSGHMARLSDSDVEVLETLDIRYNCDFRQLEEAGNERSRLPASVQVLNLSIDPGSVSDFFDHANTGAPSADHMSEFMARINAEFVRHHQHVYREVMETLLKLDDGALLINCSAGKDRTGFGAALILMALDVPRETIEYDYMLSHRYYPIKRELDRVMKKYGPTMEGGFNAEVALPMMQTRREYLARALDTIESEFGSPENYLDQAMDFGTDKRDELRNRLTL